MTATSKSHPPKLSDTGDVLIGTGLRSVKLGFVEIQVYSLGLYVDPPGCRSALVPLGFGNRDRDGLIRDPDFYPSFAAGKFRKAYRLKFCRSLGKDKMVGGFAEPLRKRRDEAHAGEAEALLSKFVPDGGVAEGDVLDLTCEGDGETLRATFHPVSRGGATDLVTVKSGGEGGVWLAFQQIFFDDNTQIPTIRVTAVADLPDVLVVDGSEEGEEIGRGDDDDAKKEKGSAASALQQSGSPKARRREPSLEEIETAIEADFVKSGSGGKVKSTWSDFAGRDPKKGGAGYKFGDLTLGVVTAMGLRKPAAGTNPPSTPLSREAAPPPTDDVGKGGGDSSSDENENETLRKMVVQLQRGASSAEEEKQKLQERVHRLELGNRKLQQAVERTEMRLTNVRRLWPLTLVLAVAVGELTGLALVRIHGVSVMGLASAKLVLCAVLGGVAGLHYFNLGKLMKSKVA